MSRCRHITAKKPYRGQCTNSWQNNRYLWSPFLLKLFCLLFRAHRELWYIFRSKLKRDLQRLLFMWHCMERCLSSWRTEGGTGAAAGAGAAEPMGAVESHIRGNLFATNTPRRENNLLIFIVGINCTDRRMHARLFFSRAISCNYACPFSLSLVWKQWFKFTKSKLLQLRTKWRRHAGTFMQAKFIEVVVEKLPKNRGTVTGMISYNSSQIFILKNNVWLEYLE